MYVQLVWIYAINFNLVQRIVVNKQTELMPAETSKFFFKNYCQLQAENKHKFTDCHHFNTRQQSTLFSAPSQNLGIFQHVFNHVQLAFKRCPRFLSTWWYPSTTEWQQPTIVFILPLGRHRFSARWALKTACMSTKRSVLVCIVNGDHQVILYRWACHISVHSNLNASQKALLKIWFILLKFRQSFIGSRLHES